VVHLEQVRAWFGRPLWDMEPPDADEYFGKVLRTTAKGTRLSRSQALKTYFFYLELRHKVEIHQMTGRVIECPIDEVNRPRGRQEGPGCGSRCRPGRSAGCSPGGGRSCRPAGSSRPPPGTTPPAG
jgi:hypothetical protein